MDPSNSGFWSRLTSWFGRGVREPCDEEDPSPFLYRTDRIAGERYRTLAWMLDQLKGKQDFSVVTITSSIPSEGKSTVAVNLAALLSERVGQRVLLIDCDLRRPRLQEMVGGGVHGLEALLAERCSFDSVVNFDPEAGFCFIPVAAPAEEPLKLLAKDNSLERVLKQARAQFDYVLLDAPPVLPVSDALLMAEAADAVLFVVRAGETSGHMVLRALSMLKKEKLLGLVFNGTLRGRSYGYDPYYRKYGRKREYWGCRGPHGGSRR